MTLWQGALCRILSNSMASMAVVFCLHPGQVIAKGKGYTRVYPAETCVEQRTHAQNLQHSEEAVQSGEPVFYCERTLHPISAT